MSRPRLYPNPAARQAAYRSRVKQRQSEHQSGRSDIGALARCPFRVANAQGQPVMAVLSDSGENRLILYAPDGSAIELVATPEYRAVVMQDASGRTEVVLEGNPAGGILELR